MRKLGLFILSPILSFIGGFYVYAWMLQKLWNQELGGDSEAVLFWGGQAYFIFEVPCYFLLIRYIDKKFKKLKLLLYSLSCMLGFVIPILVLWLIWGGGLFTPEMVLFYGFFISSGLIFAVLNWSFKNLLADKSKRNLN